jgi:extradiol dioxygenase family protein
MMQPSFHLSIGVHSIDKSVEFFESLLGAKILHRDPSGYVNIELYGSQITLKHNADVNPNLPDFHFGVNLSLEEFESVSRRVQELQHKDAAPAPEVWDAGTSLERVKMYLRCPTGYKIELKGYKDKRLESL